MRDLPLGLGGFSALGNGLLWPLFEPTPGGEKFRSHMNLLFVDAVPTLEQWPAWAQVQATWRARRPGDVLDEGEPWIPTSLS